MPQSFASAQVLPLLGAVVAFLFAALLILYIFRLLFGQRIRPPAGPRGRQRRMDVVDTFELGRDRQLIVVRRDNVEHLLLIGGPNDLLVEGSISRADLREQRPAQPREKDADAGEEWPTPPAPAPQKEAPQPPPGRIPAQESPRRRPVEAAAEAAAHYGQQGPTANAPLPPDLFAPGAPQRPAAPPAAEPQPPRPTAPGLAPRPPVAPQPPRPTSPPFLARTPRVVGGPPPPPAPPPPKREAPAQPSYGAPREGAAPQPPREPPSQKPPPAPSVAPESSSDPLESLEAEMARLLGRPDHEQ